MKTIIKFSFLFFIISCTSLVRQGPSKNYILLEGTKSKPATTLEEASKAVWCISNGLGAGTAFFISENTIVTNFHVLFMLLNKSKLKKVSAIKANDPISKFLTKSLIGFLFNFTSVFLYQKQSPLVFKLDKVLALDGAHDLAIATVKPVKASFPFFISLKLTWFQDFFEDPSYSKNLYTRSTTPYYLNIHNKTRLSSDPMSAIGYPNSYFKIFKGYNVFDKRTKSHLFLLTNKSDVLMPGGSSGTPIISEQNQVIGVTYMYLREYDQKKRQFYVFQQAKHLINLIKGRKGVNCKEYTNEDCLNKALPFFKELEEYHPYNPY